MENARRSSGIRDEERTELGRNNGVGGTRVGTETRQGDKFGQRVKEVKKDQKHYDVRKKKGKKGIFPARVTPKRGKRTVNRDQRVIAASSREKKNTCGLNKREGKRKATRDINFNTENSHTKNRQWTILKGGPKTASSKKTSGSLGLLPCGGRTETGKKAEVKKGLGRTTSAPAAFNGNRKK